MYGHESNIEATWCFGVLAAVSIVVNFQYLKIVEQGVLLCSTWETREVRCGAHRRSLRVVAQYFNVELWIFHQVTSITLVLALTLVLPQQVEDGCSLEAETVHNLNFIVVKYKVLHHLGCHTAHEAVLSGLRYGARLTRGSDAMSNGWWECIGLKSLKITRWIYYRGSPNLVSKGWNKRKQIDTKWKQTLGMEWLADGTLWADTQQKGRHMRRNETP